MKHLTLYNESYKAVLKSYTQWLDILGFAQTTVYNLPNHLKEFFNYLESRNIKTINDINSTHVSDYYNYLKTRDNKRRSGSLSHSYLNKHQQALFKFKEYLQAHNHKGINIHLKREEQNHRNSQDILTQDEIKQLFKATNYSNPQERIRKRDKVILVLLYSCGLRRNEVINIEIKDIIFDKERIHVRKGKNYKERLVPINGYNLKIIEEYLYDYRLGFYNHKQSENLLINYRGKPLQGQSLCNRLTAIVKCANLDKFPRHAVSAVVDREELGRITPHCLRHSIATHLLEKGANIETISQFLGHSSLESTQIYTHLLEDKATITKDEELHKILREKRLQHQSYPNIPEGIPTVRLMDE